MPQQENPEWPTVTIQRDPNLHRWVYRECAADHVKTPWSDDSPADMVVRWLRLSANGKLNVRVDLS